MSEPDYDWKSIAKNPKFVTLHRKKSRFLFGLWVFGAIPYFLLTLGAAYAPDIFTTRVIGRMNLGYVFCLVQFFVTVAIGVYYTYITNEVFDPLTRELLEELEPGGSR